MNTIFLILAALVACLFLLREVFLRFLPMVPDETEKLWRCARRGDPVALRELLRRGEITEAQLPPHLRQE